MSLNLNSKQIKYIKELIYLLQNNDRYHYSIKGLVYNKRSIIKWLDDIVQKNYYTEGNSHFLNELKHIYLKLKKQQKQKLNISD